MSKIQWCDVTQNPVYIRKEDGTNGGHWCAKKSEGCANCYSEEINQSGFFQFASHMAYTGKPPENLYFDESIVKSWARARKPQKRFIGSMTDLFGEWVPREWQFKVFDGAAAAPTQTIQLLTKRPEVAVKASQEWCAERDRLYLPENCWMGVSVENQARADERRDAWRSMAVLVHPDNGVTWVSYEPALGCVDWDGWELINLMVIGGESGSKAREFHLDWGRKAIEWCQEWDIAPFVKQLGSNAVDSSLADIWGPEKKPLHHYTQPWDSPIVEQARTAAGYSITNHKLSRLLQDKKGGNIDEFPEDLRVREFPKV